jgi:hypothetical protein
LSSYLEANGLSWENCASNCIDGAPSMVGSIKKKIRTLSQHTGLLVFKERYWFQKLPEMK